MRLDVRVRAAGADGVGALLQEAYAAYATDTAHMSVSQVGMEVVGGGGGVENADAGEAHTPAEAE